MEEKSSHYLIRTQKKYECGHIAHTCCIPVNAQKHTWTVYSVCVWERQKHPWRLQGAEEHLSLILKECPEISIKQTTCQQGECHVKQAAKGKKNPPLNISESSSILNSISDKKNIRSSKTLIWICSETGTETSENSTIGSKWSPWSWIHSFPI